MRSHPKRRMAVYMRLSEDGRQFLIELMEVKGDSLRKLASIAGYNSHSYVGRLLDPNDPARTVTLEAGTLIAQHYGVLPHRLFVTEVSPVEGQKVSPKRTDMKRGARPTAKAAA